MLIATKTLFASLLLISIGSVALAAQSKRVRTPPIIKAAGSCMPSLVAKLIKKGADPNTKDSNGNTALSVARKNNCHVVESILLRAKDPKALDQWLIRLKEGNAFLTAHYCPSNGRKRVARPESAGSWNKISTDRIPTASKNALIKAILTMGYPNANNFHQEGWKVSSSRNPQQLLIIATSFTFDDGHEVCRVSHIIDNSGNSFLLQKLCSYSSDALSSDKLQAVSTPAAITKIAGKTAIIMDETDEANDSWISAYTRTKYGWERVGKGCGQYD
ncbi:MAG: ankyrin repeat domain-containing protein [Elusimicrobia bacterium]|nr:ankyrin repeat domain-containing protein [Elusimicrobiota bacterium]